MFIANIVRYHPVSHPQGILNVKTEAVHKGTAVSMGVDYMYSVVASTFHRKALVAPFWRIIGYEYVEDTNICTSSKCAPCHHHMTSSCAAKFG